MTGRTQSSALLRDPGVAAALLGAAPAWLWDVAEGRILLASAGGIDFFGEPDLAALSAREFDMRRPAMAQLARIGASLPQDGSPRLSLLRFFVGFRDISIPCQCRLVGDAGRDLVLAVANSSGSVGGVAARATAAFATVPYPVVLKDDTGELYRNAAAADLPADAGVVPIRVELPDGVFELIADFPDPSQADQNEQPLPDAGQATPSDVVGAVAQSPESGDKREDTAADVPQEGGGPAEDKDVLIEDTQPSETTGSGLAARVLPETRRFTFLLDPDGRFAEVGAGFAALVGPQAADVVGKTWSEISEGLDLDPQGRLSRALGSRDTWSDVHIDWPTDFGERAKLRLSALPRFGEGRAFVGFRGFADVLSVTPAELPDIVEPVEPLEPAGVDERVDESSRVDERNGETVLPGETVDRSESDDPTDEVGAADVMFAETDVSTGVSTVHRLHKLQVVPPESGALNDQERGAFQAIAEALGARWQGEPARSASPAEAGTSDQTVDVTAPDDETAEETAEEIVASEEARSADAGSSGDVATDQPDSAGVAPIEDISEEVVSEEDLPADGILEGLIENEPTEDEDPISSSYAVADVREPSEDGLGALVRDVLDRVPLGLAVVRDERLLMANRTFLELFGYPDLDDLEVAGGLGALLQGRGEEAAGSGTAVTARRSDGSTFAVEARLGRTPWIDGPAMLMSVREARLPKTDAGAGPDAQNEPAIDTVSVAELKAVLDTALDGVVMLDADATILTANAGADRLFGVAAGGLAGTSFVEQVAKDDRAAVTELVDGLKAGVPSLLEKGREVAVLHEGGAPVPVLLTMARIGETEPARFCGVLSDLRDWKESEADLVAARKRAEDASEQKSDFLAKMSHEIRTPLNGIIGFSEVILEERFGPLGNDRYREYLKDIRQSGEHLMSLVNDLLDLSKVEAGKLELSFTGVKLNDLVEQSVAITQPQSNRARVIVRTSLAHALPAIVADARSIRQVLLNLLSNAIKFTPPGGQVIVSTALNDAGDVYLRVRDTGPGMSESDVAVALEPFRQLPVTPTTGEKGTGLGLPLAKALVEANRATFSLQSKLNEGTLIEVCFPQARVLAE